MCVNNSNDIIYIYGVAKEHQKPNYIFNLIIYRIQNTTTTKTSTCYADIDIY